MPSILTAQLFGKPKLLWNQKPLTFTFSKIPALIYYLLIEGTVQRETIASLLWEQKTTQQAKKNLRNTIYQANKTCQEDLILSPNRHTIQLNPDIVITSDVMRFLSDPDKQLPLYQGELLDGFYLKDCPSFDFWLAEKRQEFEQIYKEAVYTYLQKTDANPNMSVSLLESLIALDPFDEKPYQKLMLGYHHEGQSGKAIETYFRLAHLLHKELGVSPSSALQNLYHTIINEEEPKTLSSPMKAFIGRDKEIKTIEQFLSHSDAHWLTIYGDKGVGKHSLLKEVLNHHNQKVQLFSVTCYQEDQPVPFITLKSLLEQIAPMARRTQLEQAPTVQNLKDRLSQLPSRQQHVFLIENSNWIDEASERLLLQLSHHFHLKQVSFILLTDQKSPSSLLLHLKEQGNPSLTLHPLNEEEISIYLKQKLGSRPLLEEELLTISEHSQGNLFLLSEYASQLKKGGELNLLSPPIRDFIHKKLSSYAPKETKILQYLACFMAPISLKTLARLMDNPQEDLIASLDLLLHDEILKEEEIKGRITLRFTQPLYPLYYEQELSLSKKRFYHERIAQTLEREVSHLSQNPSLLKQIAHHYQKAKQTIKYLTYQLEFLEATLPFQHELFPLRRQVIRVTDTRDTFLSEHLFEPIWQHLKACEADYKEDPQFQRLTLRLRYLEGRHAIRLGQYQKGLQTMQQVIRQAESCQETAYLLDGYRQLIYYCIQVENTDELLSYTDLALEAAIAANNYEAIAIQLRLKGLYHLIVGEEEDAKTYLQRSIACFSLTPFLKEKYALQIAAALDYLAEIAQINQDFSHSLALSQEALDLIDQQKTEPARSLCLIGMGVTYYHMGQKETAKSILDNAKQHLAPLGFPWKETQLEIYLALIDLENGKDTLALTLLAKKDDLIWRYGNPRDRGLMAYFMAKLRYQMTSHKRANPAFPTYVTKPFTSYYETAKTYLNPYRDRLPLEELENLRQLLG